MRGTPKGAVEAEQDSKGPRPSAERGQNRSKPAPPSGYELQQVVRCGDLECAKCLLDMDF